MSPLVEPEPVETLEFKWGTKRGRGGKKKEVQFYESFTYDGVDYTLYDTVYLYKEGEPEPYIGKLIKIWEHQDKIMAKKVKVHWFFRPSEISNWIEEGMVLEKEIFLASGEGVCTAGVNPLESISGKCNVVCTIDDERNPQPTPQELELADHFFYRTFNVEHCTISDLVGDKVAGLEVKFVFNRKENRNNSEVVPDKKDKGGKAMSDDAVDPRDVKKISFQRNLSSSKATSLCRGSKDIKIDKPNGSYPKTNIEDGVKLAKTSGDLENRLLSKSVAAGSEVSCKNMTAKSMETLNVESNDSKALKQNSSFTDRMMNSGEKQTSSFTDRMMNSGETKDSKALKQTSSFTERMMNSGETKDSKALKQTSSFTDNRMMNSGETKDSKALKQTSSFTDRMMNSGETKDSKALKQNSSFTDRMMNRGETKDSMVSDKLVKGAKSDMPSIKLDSKSSLQKPGTVFEKNNGKDLVTSGRKRKPNDDCVGPDKDLKQQKTEEKMTKLSDGKLPNASARDSPCEGRSEADKFLVTRKPNDPRSKWFKLPPWEERIKTAYEQAMLVQLSNLDPNYTSSEVEDIIWHAFEEHCTAKMVQRTASSSPNYGHAFIITKTRAVADMIIKKLEDGCLILSNGRPLVGSRVPHLSFPGKQSTFVGHLSVDKMKHHMQRDMREAVSTSHCSQPNTIEFEMAMDWCLLQSRSDGWWKRLYKKQGEEMRKLKANLKLKPEPNTSSR